MCLHFRLIVHSEVSVIFTTTPSLFLFFRFDWVESERAIILHVSTHCQVSSPLVTCLRAAASCLHGISNELSGLSLSLSLSSHSQTLKKSDVVLDVNGTSFEAAIFINDWVYELKIGK